MALTALLVNVVMFGSTASAWAFPKLPQRKKIFISSVKIASRRKRMRRSQKSLSSSKSAHPHRQRHPVPRRLSLDLWPLNYLERTRVDQQVKIRRSTGLNITNLRRQHYQSPLHTVRIPHRMVLSITTIRYSQATRLPVQCIQLFSNPVQPRPVRNILQTQLFIETTLLHQVIISHSRILLSILLVKTKLTRAMAHQFPIILSLMARHNKTTIRRLGHSI